VLPSKSLPREDTEKFGRGKKSGSKRGTNRKRNFVDGGRKGKTKRMGTRKRGLVRSTPILKKKNRATIVKGGTNVESVLRAREPVAGTHAKATEASKKLGAQ